MEEAVVDEKMAGAARRLLMLTLGLFVFQGFSAVAQGSNSTFDTIHLRTGELLTVITLLVLITSIKASFPDSKVKGMAIGLFAMTVIQLGLGMMSKDDPAQILAWIHGSLAMAMMAHAAMMLPKMKIN